MIVIADTSPLHYLILLEHTEVLQHLYGSVVIPQAVVCELQAEKTPSVVRRWITGPPAWLQVRQIVVPPDPAARSWLARFSAASITNAGGKESPREGREELRGPCALIASP